MSIQHLESQIDEILEHQSPYSLQHDQQRKVDVLEQQVKQLKREEKKLRVGSIISKCLLFCSLCVVLMGVLLPGVRFVIFLNLLLVNIDTALNSDGPYTGYMFPLDYILYTVVVIFLVLSYIKGIKTVGKTHPRDLLLAVLSLMYIILALNVIMFSLIPTYTTFGNQRYRPYQNDTSHNATVVESCGATSLLEKDDNCVPTRISVILLAFQDKVWFFGAPYYWLIWVLLGTVALLYCCNLYWCTRLVVHSFQAEMSCKTGR